MQGVARGVVAGAGTDIPPPVACRVVRTLLLLHALLLAVLAGGGEGRRVPAPLPALRGRRFDNTDASSSRVLAADVFGYGRTASLVNPLTGDAAPLPYAVA